MQDLEALLAHQALPAPLELLGTEARRAPLASQEYQEWTVSVACRAQ